VTFRWRLLLAFLAIVLVPMVAFAWLVRNEMSDRLTAQYERRVRALVTVIEEDLVQRSAAIGRSLAALKEAAVDDNDFRRAVVDRAADLRGYLLDYAAGAMQVSGLDMLQIQDEAGRILSSGHFRNEFDRLEPELPKLLAAVPGRTALVQARAPDAPFLALARVDSFEMGGRRLTIVGGVRVAPRFLGSLAREGPLSVSLLYPGGELSSSESESSEDGSEARTPAVVGAEATDSAGFVVAQELSIPFVDGVRGKLDVARIRVTHPLTELTALRRSIDRWFLIAVAATVLLAALLATWLASRISRPLVELADKTARIDLDRLDIDFASRRKDEIGSLSRLLGAMTERLRASASRIKEAERRATLGELARQVNHDIKNGLMPIRNVFRHLSELARDQPAQLADVFRGRQGTIESSIAYLEKLSSNYARLAPRVDREPCDVNAAVQHVVNDARATTGAEMSLRLCRERTLVSGDPLAVRRILENLVGNAVDSLEGSAGAVSVSTGVVEGSTGRRVQITVSDTGCGISEERIERIFDDFYTTKDGGTGLGLSIVRRLVMDLNGAVRVESELGKGSRFIVELPLEN
jgi:signal transduction histidine kinase